MSEILFIDDDAFNTLLAKKIFSKSGVLEQVKWATNGSEALAYINSTTMLPSYIFLDQNMPIMNGAVFLNALLTANTDFSKTKIYLMISGEIPREFITPALGGLVNQYIERPLKLSLINSLLGGVAASR